VEKLDYLLWDRLDGDPWEALLERPGVRAVTVQVADPELPTTLLMGEGGRLAALASVWLSSYDLREAVEQVLSAACERLDGYLVTESEPQPLEDRDWPDGDQSPGISHVTWFPKPERLTEEQFLHGWHEVHTPHSAELHPLRWTYLRDTVVRTLTPGSPEVRAIVVERFREVADYADPKRLFGSTQALEQNMVDLPGYADLDSISSCPMVEVVLRSR
jgi:hypothetical protein